jgi:tetratricopeptide (TPR) repeat protein
MNERREARAYYLQLFSMDTPNASVYAFFLGIASYRQKNYTDAIIYLKQAKIPEYEADRLQYLLLAYKAIGDDTNTMRTFELLLSQNNLESIHFRLYFDFVFFDPYATNKPFTLFEKNIIPTSSYLESCFRILPATEQSVCMYGQA